MFQLTEEQVEEIQVLESIYGNAFSRKFLVLFNYLCLNSRFREQK